MGILDPADVRLSSRLLNQSIASRPPPTHKMRLHTTFCFLPPPWSTKRRDNARSPFPPPSLFRLSLLLLLLLLELSKVVVVVVRSNSVTFRVVPPAAAPRTLSVG